MTEHFHDRDNVAAWSRQQMASHLRDDHGIRTPMAWDLSHQLNNAHLKAHQTPVNQPEETPVPAPSHSHGDISRHHDEVSKSVLDEHLRLFHGIQFDSQASSVFGLHAHAHAYSNEAAQKMADAERPERVPYTDDDRLADQRGQLTNPIGPDGRAKHDPVACGAVNPDVPIVTCTYPAGHGPITDPEMYDSDYPMQGTFDHGNAPGQVWWTLPKAPAADPAPEDDALTEEEKVELLARNMHAIRTGPGADWDDLQQETRDYWRGQARTKMAEYAPPEALTGVVTPPEVEPDEGPRRLWMDTDRRVAANWNTLSEETKGYWRRQYQIRQDKERQREIGYGAAFQERQEKAEAEGITRDRIICALAEVDFDQDWVSDNGLGPNGRGAIRKVYKDQAARLLAWINRGGILEVPKIRELARDYDREKSLVEDLEDTNNALREQLALTGRQLEQAKEAGRVLERERDEAVRRRQDIFQEMGILREEIERLEALGEERQVQHHAILAERDALGLRVNTLTNLVDARTQALDKGRAALREFIAGIKRDFSERDDILVGTVVQSLEKILGYTVSTAEPIVARPTEGFGENGYPLEHPSNADGRFRERDESPYIPLKSMPAGLHLPRMPKPLTVDLGRGVMIRLEVEKE